MSIKALARAAGETVETVHLCEREGLLRPMADEGYDETALAVLRLMRLGQRLRIPLEDIKAAAGALGAEASLQALLRSWALKRLAWIAREQNDLHSAQAILCSYLSRSQPAPPAMQARAMQELVRLHRAFGAPADAPIPRVRPPPTPSPRQQQTAARSKASGSAVPPAPRDEAERATAARLVL